ncbi:excisionase family protein [Leptolyngbya sp. AN02str]|uniref:excisionase family protein n=1 Tax=Leptolyngbyaceae TaxID=1890438 RepID=UPI000A9B7FD9|nr:excisionase family protein [Leptolyngbya sp. 'hensonii']
MQARTAQTENESIDRSHVAALVQSIDAANLPATLVAKQGIIAAISVSNSTLKNYRKQFWIEGIHYFYLGPKLVRYNLELIVDWAIHRGDPQAHQRAIEAFLFKLESNQSTKKRQRQSK